MAGIFQFKQFAVDQTGCAMKINTDGVLLGAMAGEGQPQSILDIGTGTGVIALMLAQRFQSAHIDAVEIDETAAARAAANFAGSPFAHRLTANHANFACYLNERLEEKYDLIVSNPPFYIDSLASPVKEKNTAKHAGDGFFETLIQHVVGSLSPSGQSWLILPVNTAGLVKGLLAGNGLFLQKSVNILSFPGDVAHREIIVLSREHVPVQKQELIIYKSPKVYTSAYRELLKDFLTIF